MALTPESRGLSSVKLEGILRRLDEAGVPMHSMLVARGGDIVLNAYWAPYSRDKLHRMNSVTKSFVALAIGALIDEGRLSLSDKIIDYFPEAQDFNLNKEQAELTIENLITMRTGYRPEGNGHWVRDREYGRIKKYFEYEPKTERGDSFYYDSAGSYILGVIVERLTGKGFIKYLQEKFLDKIGFSKNADCIKGGEGYSWSDSGLLCTTEDLYKTARFINAGGVHDGVRYLSEDFLSEAIKCQVKTSSLPEYKSYGYGYQIWKAKYDGFMFLGMGAQIMIYIPARDLYLVCTADTQPSERYREKIVELFYELIDDDYSCGADTLEENPKAYASLCEYVNGLKLVALPKSKSPEKYTNMQTKIYKTEQNPMGIKNFSFEFSENLGVFHYENAQGEKNITFGFGYNEFSHFPEDGYFDMEIGKSVAGHRYPIAASAEWQSDTRLVINIQFIGRHLGGDIITVDFDADAAHLSMHKTTNCFLDRYAGEALGK